MNTPAGIHISGYGKSTLYTPGISDSLLHHISQDVPKRDTVLQGLLFKSAINSQKHTIARIYVEGSNSIWYQKWNHGLQLTDPVI